MKGWFPLAGGGEAGEGRRQPGWAAWLGRLGGSEVVWLKDREWRRLRYAAAAVAAGLALLLLLGEIGRGPATGGRPGAGGWAGGAASTGVPAGPPAGGEAGAAGEMAVAALERQVAADLERVLSRIAGAGEVHVRVALAGGLERLYAGDRDLRRSTTEERDRTGGTRVIEQVEEAEKVVAMQGGGGQEPVLTQLRRPEVLGVLVVAQGAADPAVRAALTRAVHVALDVPYSRVEVLPGGPAGGGEGP